MLEFRLRLTVKQKQELNNRLKASQRLGQIKKVKRIMALLSLSEGQTIAEIAGMLRVSSETIRLWLRAYLLKGIHCLERQQSPGRPAKLTKAQKQELANIIEAGPQAAGFSSGCWRSPMIQHLILEKYGQSYSVHYISQLLKNLGFSFQKARFIASHLDEEKRQQWLESTWPQVLKLAKEKNAYILFGDEASFPQWGTLSYTWARRGQQPTLKTSGIRKSYKVFGLVEYFTGKFFYQALNGKFNSHSYQQFLWSVLQQTRKHLIIIQDGARYHTSKSTRTFFAAHCARISVFNLPAYSPDFNPIEGLWKRIKDNFTHLVFFPDFDSLIATVDLALADFANSNNELLLLFAFYDNQIAA